MRCINNHISGTKRKSHRKSFSDVFSNEKCVGIFFTIPLTPRFPPHTLTNFSPSFLKRGAQNSAAAHYCYYEISPPKKALLRHKLPFSFLLPTSLFYPTSGAKRSKEEKGEFSDRKFPTFFSFTTHGPRDPKKGQNWSLFWGRGVLIFVS